MSTRSNRSRKTSKSRQSWRSTRTTQTTRTQNTIRTKLLKEIKNKHGFTNTQAWHIKPSLLACIEQPNPFNKLISSHDKLSNQLQSCVCSTLSTVIETIIAKKQPNSDTNTMDTDMADPTETQPAVTVTYTELFAVFMTLFENKTNSDQHTLALIILFSYLIPKTAINVLLKQFDTLAQIFGQYLYLKSSTISASISVQYCMDCMSAMLLSRISHNKSDISLWKNRFCQKMLQGLFVLSTDQIGTVRKAALKHIKKIFKSYDLLPKIIRDLMRCFIERQIKGILNENSTDNNTKGIDLNVIGFISELLMETLEYLSLKESSYIVTILFNIISYCMQTFGDNTIQIKHLNLQQMFLKLILKFIKGLPKQFSIAQAQSVESEESKSNNEMNIDELANELKDKIDLKKLCNDMAIDDLKCDDISQDRYVKFMTQLFEVIQQLKPQKTDSIGIPIYYDCIVAVIEVLYVFDKSEALKRCISIVSIIFDGFESNKKKIVEKASNSVVNILEIIVTNELIEETKQTINGGKGIDMDPLPSLSPHASFAMDSNIPRHKLPVLQRIIVLIESLLDFKHKSSWIYVFQLCAHLFKIFAENGFFLLCNILLELSEIRCMETPIFLSNLEEAIASAIKHCGPENVLNIIPLNLPTFDTLQLITLDKAILKANLWILPLMKANVNRTNLAFFGQRLLPIADAMMKQRAVAIKKAMKISEKQFDSMCHMLWNIFPSFCIYPRDFSETFPKIAESIAYYLINVTEVRPYISAGFVHLINKPLQFIKRENEKGIFGSDMIDNAKGQIETIAKFTANFMPILCNILTQTANDKRFNFLKCIQLFSAIGDRDYIRKHFKRTMEKCLTDDISLLLLRKEIMDTFEKNEQEMMDKSESMKAKYETLLNQETVYLLILNQMIDSIDLSELESFWAFLKQQFTKTDQSPLIEKLLYRNLYSVLKYKECLLLQNAKQLSNFITFILKLNTKRLCIGGKHQRLNCILTLFDCLAEMELDTQNETENFIEETDTNVVNITEMKENKNSFLNTYPLFIGELIENISLSNLKIRKISLEIIELIAQRLSDISIDLFNKFIYKLLGGLLSKSDTMQSATILCITYLIVQFELRISPQILSQLLKTISLRIENPSNNVIKASLDFIQIIIQELPDTILNANLMDLLTTLLQWLNEDSKKRKFKHKITKCIDLLIKRFGYAKITKIVPHRFQRLIKYLRKRADYLKNKRERKKKLDREMKLENKILNKKLEELPPNHPLNVESETKVSVSDSDSDNDCKLTVFEELRTERMKNKNKSKKSLDLQSVRMKIDGTNGNITDLLSKTAVKKQLLSEYECNKLLVKQRRIDELGIDNIKGAKRDQHIRELEDGRLLITLSDDENDKKNYKTKKWKDLSDEDRDSDSESDLSDLNNGNERDIDDIMSKYSKYNKTTQLKRALSDVSQSRSKRNRNKRLSLLNSKDVISKRRKLLASTKNDSWLPGELQPYAFHQMSSSLLNRKKKHLRQNTFERVMGRKRNVAVRTDSFVSNSLKISRTRKISHGRYTLKKSQIKAKQRHLYQDIQNKHRENQVRRARAKSRSKSKSKKRKRGTKRRLHEM